MPQKLNFSIYQLDTTFQTTIPSSLMTPIFPPLRQWISLVSTHNLNWKLHISSLAKTASKVRHSEASLPIFSFPQLLKLYKALVHSCMDYSLHVWGNSTHPAQLDKMKSKAFCLINSPLTVCVQPLSLCRNVASLAIFYCYFHADCFADLTNCIPPVFLQPHYTRLSSSSHPYSVQFSNARVNPYSQSFIPFSCKLWNSLPASVSTTSYGFNSI